MAREIESSFRRTDGAYVMSEECQNAFSEWHFPWERIVIMLINNCQDDRVQNLNSNYILTEDQVTLNSKQAMAHNLDRGAKAGQKREEDKEGLG